MGGGTNGVGSAVKVDTHTLQVGKGEFARLCVEVDLTQPVYELVC